MPIARFQMPDGKVVRFDVPEGTTPEQAQALFDAQAPNIPELASYRQSSGAPSEIPGPRAQQKASTADIITSAPYRAAAGTADVLLTAPQNIANLAKMGYGALTTALGRPDLAPDVTAPRQPVAEALTRMGLIKEPQGEMTPGQRVIDVALQGATGALMASPSAIARAAPTLAGQARAATGMASTGALTGTAGQLVTEATGEPALGLATSMAAPGLMVSNAQARQARLQAQKRQNAVRDLTIRQAQAEGFVTTPGSVTPNAQNVLVERIAGKTRVQDEATTQNQKTVDKLARRAVGIGSSDDLTRENMRSIRQEEFDKGYVPLNRIGSVQTDQSFNQALDDVLNAYTGPGRSFPGAIPQPVTDLVNNYRVGQFNSADAIAATRTLRDAANANREAGDHALGLAQRAISNALEDQIERTLAQSGNSNAQAMLEQFRASRQRMAISHAVEDAIVEGGGSLNPRQFANDLQTRGRYFSGDLDLIARFANIARPVMKPPGTTGTPGAQTFINGGLGGGLGGLVGYFTGGPPGAALGGFAGAVAPQVASSLAKNYLLSSFGQSRAIPTYSRPGVNALSDVDANALATMMGIPTFTNQSANQPR